jgi:hypothetical protein
MAAASIDEQQLDAVAVVPALPLEGLRPVDSGLAEELSFS